MPTRSRTASTPQESPAAAAGVSAVVPGRVRSSVAPVLLAIVATLAAPGCGAEHSLSPADWKVGDGRRLGEWVEGEAAAAVLVMDPDDCFTCYSVLGPWLKARSRHEGEMFFLFTREPDDAERRTIRAAGIRADGVIEAGGPPPQATPVELAFREGHLVYHAVRVSGASPLLDRLDDETLEQIVAAPPTATADPQSAHRILTSEGGDDE